MKRAILPIIIILVLIFGLGISNVFARTNADSFVDVIVRFDRTPGEAEKDIFRSFGGTVTHSFTVVPAVAGSFPERSIGALERNPRVTAVELDFPVYAVGYDSSDEYGNTWGVGHIKADLAHEKEYYGENIKVAVIDSGVDYSHKDLKGNFDLNDLGFDFVRCTQEDDPDDCKPMDVYGHGTHVAGTVAATLDGFGVVGVAPKAQLISLRILNDDGVGSSVNVIAALEWIMKYNNNSDNPIRITNNSYGRGTESGSIREAFDNAANAGVLHIAAAGNSGNPAGKNDSVIYPAKYESVVAVSAIDKNNRRPSWSSTGPDVELTAPGVSVLSTWNSETSYSNPQPICMKDENQECHYYKEGSGTSMSSPHVAGAAALVWASDVSLTNEEVRNHLQRTAEDIGLDSNQQGYGMVNAYNAVMTPVEELPDGDDSENGTDPGDGEEEDLPEGLHIEIFEVTNASNPAWARVNVKWSVSESSGNLDKVVSEMRLAGGSDVLDSASSSVSGYESNGEHGLRVRGGHGKKYEITLIVFDIEGNFKSEVREISL